jgi:hypothetical protein
MLGIDAAVPDLLTLVEKPESIAGDLAGEGRTRLVARERLRQAAAWSLGELHAVRAAPLLMDAIRREPMAPSTSAFVGALRHLGDHAAVELICTKLDQWVVWEPWAYEYGTIAALDPSAFPRLLPPNRSLPLRPSLGYPVPSGWWDGFIIQPAIEVLPTMLTLKNPQDREPWVKQAFRTGLPRLPRDQAIAALRAQLAGDRSDGERAFLLCLLARLSDQAELVSGRTVLSEAVRLAVASGGGHPWEELSFVVPVLPQATIDRDLAPVVAAIDVAHPSGLMSIVVASHGPWMTERLIAAYPAAVEPQKGEIAGWLATLGGADAGRFLAANLGDAELARLWRQQGGLRQSELHAAIGSALGDLARARTLLPAVTSAPTADLEPAALGTASALPITEVTAELVSTLRPTPKGMGQPQATTSGWGRLVLRWLHESGDPAVRLAATDWLGEWVVRDFRPPCADALAELLDRAAADPDQRVRAAARKALASHINQGPFPGDEEGEAQARVLSGSLDDRAEMAQIDALAGRVGAAIDAVPARPPEAPAPPPPASGGDF